MKTRRLLTRKICSLYRKIIIYFRRLKYRHFTLYKMDIESCKDVKILQDVVVDGLGTIIIKNNAQLGVYPSPHFFSGDFYLEARNKTSKVIIGDSVFINNNARIIADYSTIEIGDKTLIGPNFFCTDSNFHSLSPKDRLHNKYNCKPVKIGSNVFIAEGVSILKGVNVGDNSVIGAGCVIDFNIPNNVIVSKSNNSYRIRDIREKND